MIKQEHKDWIVLKRQLPDNFEEVYQKYKSGEINAVKSGYLLGCTKGCFLNWVYHFEKGTLYLFNELWAKKYYERVVTDRRNFIWLDNNCSYSADLNDCVCSYDYRLALFLKEKGICRKVINTLKPKRIPDWQDLEQHLEIKFWEFTADFLDRYIEKDYEEFIKIAFTHLKQCVWHYKDKLYNSKYDLSKTFSLEIHSTDCEEEKEIRHRGYEDDFSNKIDTKVYLEDLIKKSNLSKKQKQCLKYLALGYSNRQASKFSKMSKSNIQYNQSNAIKKIRSQIKFQEAMRK